MYRGCLHRRENGGWTTISVERLFPGDVFRAFHQDGRPVLEGRHLIARAAAHSDGEDDWLVVCEPDGYVLRLNT